MTSTSDFKTGRCIEWCTELPNRHRDRKSPVFLLHDRECYFIYYLHSDNNYFCLALKQVETGINFPTFDLRIHVGFVKGKEVDVFAAKTVTVTDTRSWFWYEYQKNLESKMKLDLLNGNTMKFVFIFDIPIASSIKGETGDKSVQTSILTNPASVQTSNASGTDSCLEHLSEDFAKLLAGDAEHDVVIQCGGRTIEAHKAVLRARSNVFAAMLKRDNMAEGLPHCVELQKAGEVLLREFVRYLYTGTLPELSWDSARKLYAIGDHYAVDGLKKRCAIFMSENLKTDNACECLALSDAHRDPDLKELVVSYILDNGIPLLDDQWLPFVSEHTALAAEVLRRSYRLHKEA